MNRLSRANRWGKTVIAGWLLASWPGFFVAASAGQTQANSRAEEIQGERRQKAENLSPPHAGRLESYLKKLEDDEFLEGLTHGVGGVSARFGGLASSQGFALGVGYRQGRDYVFRTSARASLAKAYRFDLGFSMPRIAGGKLQLDLDAGHHNYPRMEYYGPGPDSDEGSRSVYRLEQTSFDASLAIVPARYLRLGITGGYLAVNVGPGVRTGVISTDEVFSPAVTPGIQDQTNFYRTGGFLEFDYRDIPGGPRSGGYYTARFLYYDDQDIRLYSFRRLDLEAHQYFPFFNKKRVIALRAQTAMTWAGAAQTVPFYMQPYVGGADTLRGFRSFRFSDDNHIVTNVEYRWESFPGLDMALFFDAGKVTNKRTQLNFHELETSAGFGFRFNARNEVFLRLDVGFSHEGFQIWFKFGNVF